MAGRACLSCSLVFGKKNLILAARKSVEMKQPSSDAGYPRAKPELARRGGKSRGADILKPASPVRVCDGFVAILGRRIIGRVSSEGKRPFCLLRREGEVSGRRAPRRASGCWGSRRAGQRRGGPLQLRFGPEDSKEGPGPRGELERYPNYGPHIFALRSPAARRGEHVGGKGQAPGPQFAQVMQPTDRVFQDLWQERGVGFLPDLAGFWSRVPA